MNNLTRSEALAQGLTRFYSEKPCRKGHIGERLVSDRSCIICKRLREKNSTKKLNYNKNRYLSQKESILIKSKDRYNRKRENILAYQKCWRDNNKEKIAAYRKENSYLYAYFASLRRKRIKLATPKWADESQIKEIYKMAAMMTKSSGKRYEVDHVIPVSSNLVCGLHWENNLQILSKENNNKKSNKLIFEVSSQD